MIDRIINKYKFLYFSLLITVLSCNQNLQPTTTDEDERYSVIKNADDFDVINQSDTVIVIGKLKEFKPWEIGKGGGIQYFDYEIRLRNGGVVPIHNTAKIDSKYLNKKIKVLGVLECGKISQTGVQNINIKRLQSIITIEILK